MKDRYKVTKKFKFILGPTSSKIITLKSKKRYVFRPGNYDSGNSVGTGGDGNFAASVAPSLAPITPNSNTAAGVGTGMDFIPSSRIMIVRWHGFQCLSNEGANADGQLQVGVTQDPIMIRRWFNFSLYRKDTAVQVYGQDSAAGYEEPTKGDLRYFGPYNPAVTPEQPS